MQGKLQRDTVGGQTIVEGDGMRLSKILPLLGGLLGAAVQAAPAEGPNRIFQPIDLFSLRYASDPEISPDGRQIAYVRNALDLMADNTGRSIWLIDAQTGAETPLVTGSGSYGSPRWSPDGSRLAYVAAADGEKPQLYVRWMASGTAVKLATLPQAPSSLAWSADGSRIAFTMFIPDEPLKLGTPIPRPEGAKWAEAPKIVSDVTYRFDGRGTLEHGYSHIFVISADGSAPRQVSFGAFQDRGPLSFTPDGRFLVFAGNRQPDWQRQSNQDSVQLLSLEDGSVTALTPPGPTQSPRLSPDGRLIAYISYEDHQKGYANEHLYVIERDGKNARCLTCALDRSVTQPLWGDNRTLYVRYADHGQTKVAKLSLDGKMQDAASGLGEGSELDRPYSGGEYSVTAAGAVAYTSVGAERPTEVSLAKSGAARQLTHLNDLFLEGKSLGKLQPLPVTSSYDKLPIDAWMVLPPDFDAGKKYPLILEIHGGPFSSYGPFFSTDYQLYAAAGYVVVYSNPRGSTSYGDAFANEIDRNYPGHDYDDLMSVVDAALAKGFVDPAQLFVTGGSGGGVLSAWIIGKTQRFRAAAVQKPVINWASEVLTTDVTTFMAKYWFGAMPWEDPEHYWARSPLSLVGDVTTPTLVVVGESDYRTPVSEAEQYYAALALKGVPTALLKVPGASHGGLAARPSQSAAKAEAIIAWFEKYRKAN
jgi:dipeptidyl aminopeptidase/acylaminoacyl peptidase